MSGSAIIVMILGIVLLWGGFAASIINAVRKGRAKK